jgi:hypothetical protein
MTKIFMIQSFEIDQFFMGIVSPAVDSVLNFKLRSWKVPWTICGKPCDQPCKTNCNSGKSDVVAVDFVATPRRRSSHGHPPGRKKLTSHNDCYSPRLCRKLWPIDHEWVGGFIQWPRSDRFSISNIQSSRGSPSTHSSSLSGRNSSVPGRIGW